MGGLFKQKTFSCVDALSVGCGCTCVLTMLVFSVSSCSSPLPHFCFDFGLVVLLTLVDLGVVLCFNCGQFGLPWPETPHWRQMCLRAHWGSEQPAYELNLPQSSYSVRAGLCDCCVKRLDDECCLCCCCEDELLDDFRTLDALWNCAGASTMVCSLTMSGYDKSSVVLLVQFSRCDSRYLKML